MSILIVEKDNKSAELIYEIFNEEKRDLFFVCDEEEAIIAFRKYKISIVIIDLESLFVDNFNLIKIMKSENSQIKIIALNSTINDCDVENYKEKYSFNILIQKDDLHKYLYDSYLKLINDKKATKIESKTLELSNADFNESLMNLMVFQKAFETNGKSF